MAVYGYARCSTSEDKQDINRQIRELKAAGADEVIFEYEHGDAKVKKNLHMLLNAATVGDSVVDCVTLLHNHLPQLSFRFAVFASLNLMSVLYSR